MEHSQVITVISHGHGCMYADMSQYMGVMGAWLQVTLFKVAVSQFRLSEIVALCVAAHPLRALRSKYTHYGPKRTILAPPRPLRASKVEISVNFLLRAEGRRGCFPCASGLGRAVRVRRRLKTQIMYKCCYANTVPNTGPLPPLKKVPSHPFSVAATAGSGSGR